MRHTKDENPRWWHVRHPLQPSRPTTNSSYSQWRKVPREIVASASLLENWIDEAERRTWFLFEASRAGESPG
jgi:hypothetical protein